MTHEELRASSVRLMKVRTFVEQALGRKVMPNEVLSFEVEQEGVKVLLNATVRGLSMRLRAIANWERASISEVQITKRGTYYAEKWLGDRVKVLG